MTKTRILIADDHGIVRKGLLFFLDRQQDMEVSARPATAERPSAWRRISTLT